MPIDRCICHKISFEQIKLVSEKMNLNTVEELQKRKICSTNCRLCVPYVKVLLRSGKTVFPVKSA